MKGPCEPGIQNGCHHSDSFGEQCKMENPLLPKGSHFFIFLRPRNLCGKQGSAKGRVAQYLSSSGKREQDHSFLGASWEEIGVDCSICWLSGLKQKSDRFPGKDVT